VARRIGSINYEILCGITARVPRSYHRDGVSV
jgi:alanine racemase